MKRFLTPILILVTGLLAVSCVNDDTIDGEITPIFTDIVTFEGNQEDRAHFSFNKIDDSPMVYLTANKPLGGDTEAGQRMLLAYEPASGQGAYESGEIVMRAVSSINTDEVRIVDKEEIEGWNQDPVFLFSLWRTGNYINLHCRLPFSEKPRRFGLVAKDNTVDHDMVDLFLVHQLKEPVTAFERVYYASFDISAIWNLPTCKGVRIHLANSNLNVNTFELLKP